MRAFEGVVDQQVHEAYESYYEHIFQMRFCLVNRLSQNDKGSLKPVLRKV